MVRKYISILLIANNGATVLNFLASLVLARLLSPSDVGIYSMTVVFVNIMHTFRDFGVGAYLVREKELGNDKIRSASGLLIASSWSISAFLFFVSDIIANIYETSEVADVMCVLAVGFILIPFSAVTQALLKRNLDAKNQAIVIAISTFAYIGSCITLAANGAGYMSMAWANLINIATCNVIYIFLRPKNIPWIPSFRNWKAVAKFGGGAAITNLLGSINGSIPDVILGRQTSPEIVGLYSRGNGMVELFSLAVMPAVNNASLPTMAKRFHAGEPIKNDLMLSVAYLSVLAWPIFIVSAMHAEDIIKLLYGDKWLLAASVVPWLCVASAVKITFALSTNTLIAIGRPYLSAIAVIAAMILRVSFPIGFGANSLVSFAILFVAADIIASSLLIVIWSKVLGVSYSLYFATLWSSVKVAFPVFIISLVAMFLPLEIPTILKLLSIAIFGFLGWYYAVILTKHPIIAEFEGVKKYIGSKFYSTKL